MIYLLNSVYFFLPIDNIVNQAPAAPTPVFEPQVVGTI